MTQDKKTEDRIVALEELTFFQEKRLKELDAVLAEQQTQLDRVEKELAAAMAVICLLREKMQDQPENAPPPHFSPERW